MELVISKKIALMVPDYYFQRAANQTKKYKMYETFIDEELQIVSGAFRGMYGTKTFVYCVTDTRILVVPANNQSNMMVYDLEGNYIIDPEIKSDMTYVSSYYELFLSNTPDNTISRVQRIIPMKYLQSTGVMNKKMLSAKCIKRPVGFSDCWIRVQHN